MKPPLSAMPLRWRKRSDEIAEHIERAISTGEFKEGAPMPSEAELAERFGVGRSSVREALFTLRQQGLVEITSGTRARVTPAAAPARGLGPRPRRPSGMN